MYTSDVGLKTGLGLENSFSRSWSWSRFQLLKVSWSQKFSGLKTKRSNKRYTITVVRSRRFAQTFDHVILPGPWITSGQNKLLLYGVKRNQ